MEAFEPFTVVTSFFLLLIQSLSNIVQTNLEQYLSAAWMEMDGTLWWRIIALHCNADQSRRRYTCLLQSHLTQV